MMTIFGREDSPRVMEYFGALNQYYLALVKAENELQSALSAITKRDQISADFESDIAAQLVKIRQGQKDLAERIKKQRREMGL